MRVLVVQSFDNGLKTLLRPISVLLYLITKVHNMTPIFRCVFCISHFFCKMRNVNLLLTIILPFTNFWQNLPMIPSKGFGVEKIPILVLDALFTDSRITKEKLELFAIQICTCHYRTAFPNFCYPVKFRS